jgi:hypothetical protein
MVATNSGNFRWVLHSEGVNLEGFVHLSDADVNTTDNFIYVNLLLARMRLLGCSWNIQTGAIMGTNRFQVFVFNCMHLMAPL